jgi:ArsR family transcriptional regulator
MLYALYETPQAVSSLAERLDLPQPTVSRHLGILRERSLVNTDRQGTTIVYSIADPTIIHVLDTMRQLLRNLLERQTNALE